MPQAGQSRPQGLRRLCTTLAPQALRRVVEAVLLLRPDAALQPSGKRVR